MAVVAADFAGNAVGNVFVGRVVPFEVVVAVFEVDVGLVEDCCPLERRGYRVQGQLSRDLSMTMEWKP